MQAQKRRKVWLIGGYGPNGGNIIAYHVGLILWKHFNCKITVVSFNERCLEPHPMFEHEEVFDSILVADFIKLVEPNDFMISHGSFSNRQLGLRVKCEKLMFVQSFNTFKLLDVYFDHYVVVSSFVKRFLKSTYNLEAQIISPFIDFKKIPKPIPWNEKKDELLVYPKFNKDQFSFFFASIKNRLIKENIPFTVLDDKKKIEQKELYETINQYKYFLTLSIAEGFGLVPLEAMSMGVVVLGFNGYGGRQYMQVGKNCLTVEHQKVHRIFPNLKWAIENDLEAQKIGAQAKATATNFSYKVFENRWISYFFNIFEKKLKV